MHRILTYSESLLLALSFALTHITPAACRNTGRLLGQLRHRGRFRRASWRGGSTAVALGLFLLPVPGRAQTTAAAAPASASVGAALPAEMLQLRREGNEAMYNIDYSTARAKFEEIRNRAPQHPAGDLYLATVIWLEQLNKSRRLQTGLYSDDSRFYAGAEKASESSEGDAVDPAVDRAFRDRMAQAKTKALALVARNKNDPDALYFLGAFYGVMAGYEASTARKFFAAMRNGSRCVDAHEKVLALRPDYYDAYLSVGMYDYIVGNLPFAYKALAAIAGVRGNKKRGIARLQTIVEKESATADDARVMLLAIYQNEKRYEDGLKLLEQLSAKYPNSYLLKLETASMLVTLQRPAEAFAAFDALLKDPAATAALDLVHYQYAEALALNKEFQRAADHFLAVPQAKNADASLATLSLLRAAQIYDLAGQRADAIRQYQAVLARPNVYDTREQAEKGIKQPYQLREKKA
ncbi:MAG: tetratricopeptide repeat protein [Blastocatellia bacterium]|nr:tetratricopeptide repeat protein [Blastocatellia bacterium]